MLGWPNMNVREIYNIKPEDEKMFNNFIKKVDIKDKDECWLWNAAINPLHKYGMFWFRDKWTLASRVSMYFKQGYVTEGMHVCHDPIVCKHKHCVNPFHLREDTPSANIKDLVVAGNHNNKRKTHCPKKHEYSEDNTYYHNNKRFCKTCLKEYQANYRRKKENYVG